MNGSRLRLWVALPAVALTLACTTGTVGTEPDLAGEQVAEGVPDAPPVEPTPSPAPKPKLKRKPKPALPATAPEPPKAEPPPVTTAESPKSLGADEVVAILGKKVFGPSGEDLGRVVNVLVDQTGRTRAAVIDFGGFLGVGSRKIAVSWDQLTFKPGSGGDRSLALSMTREQIQGAREYKERATDQVEVAAPPASGQAPAKPPN